VVDGGDVPEAWLSRDDGGQVTLLGGWSPTSGRHHFLRRRCVRTRAPTTSRSCRWSRRGTLWAWTAVTSAPPGHQGPVPYGFGIVELDRVGLRVVGRLTEPDPSALWYAQPMEAVADELPGANAGVMVVSR
jgi:uncharacterized OB-fold protein